jgi:hypothetical protein
MPGWLRDHPILTATLLIAIVLMALAGSFFWQIGTQARALDAARTRWQAQPIGHYRIAVRMLGWGACRQEATVRNERVASIAENGCRYFSPRTVSNLFTEIERFLRSPEIGSACRRGLPGRGCACFARYHVSAIYNQQRGFPEMVQVTWGRYEPNRLHLDYWRYLFGNLHEPRCGGPVDPPGRHLVVELLEPLP